LVLLVEYFSITVSFSYSYSDKAPTFTMPTVKASVPDHTVVDTSIIDFYFTDADYADYYVDYGPDYSSAYFYFDTSKCKANLNEYKYFLFKCCIRRV